MKTRSLLSILLCFCMAFHLQSQQCTNPPDCIQNGDLLGPTTSGNMNSTPALTVPNWFVSHGTPTYGPSEVWMWSYQNRGEGIYTCYNFIAGHQYRVCLSARYAGTTNLGDMLISACSGLVGVAGTTPPTPASNQGITTANITNPVMTQYNYVFTANANYSQLWIRPMFAGGGALPPVGMQYAITVDNIHVEDLSIPDPVITVTPSGPLLNGVPVTLTASGGPAGTVYNWSDGTIGNSTVVTPDCRVAMLITVAATYNNCPTPGIPICARTTPATNFDVLTSCCANVRTNVYCNGGIRMMDFWITNTSSFLFNAYRLYDATTGLPVAWNNAISISPGSTGGVYSIDLTALGYAPGSTVCFYLVMIRYGADLCPEEKCETDRFCVTVPKDCNQEKCCGDWGLIAFDDYSDPDAPVSRLTQCGAQIQVPCGNINGFDFSYNCREGCRPSFRSTVTDPTGGTIPHSGSTSGSWYRISNLPLTTSGVYRITVEAWCGGELCGTCDLYVYVNCDLQPEFPNEAPRLHSIIPNPAHNSTTVLSYNGPVGSYEVQGLGGITLLSGKGIVNNEVTIDLSSLPNGLYTVIVDGKTSYKFVKE